MKDLYKILKVSKTATDREIKKAYKTLAIINHPDKGGDEDMFKEIAEAYSILSTPDKKKMYDLGGYESVSGAFSNNSPFDMFNSFSSQMFDTDIFNNNNNQNNNQKLVSINITINDLYSGCRQCIDISTKIKCIKCDGRGHKLDGTIICSHCNGSKFLKTSKSFGPFTQVVNSPCNHCNQTGIIIKDNCGCTKCNNTGTIDSTKKYNLNITKGSDLTEIVVKGMGDYIKELNKRNDLIIRINEQPSDRFIRNGRDIYIEEDINLWDSILGSDHIIKYIDKDIIINIDKIIDPNIFMKVDKFGMPEFNHLKQGDLIIKFNIIYPDSIQNKNSIKKLVDHPIYDHSGININYFNRVETMNHDSDDTSPTCVQQ